MIKPRILLPLEQRLSLSVSGPPPPEPRLTLRDVLERAAFRVRAEPGALASALYNELVLQGWDSARIPDALRFGPTPWLRLVKGILPRSLARVSMRHRSRVLGARVLSRGELCSWSDDGIVICWDLRSAGIKWWLGTHADLAAAALTEDESVLITATVSGQVAGWDVRRSATLLWERAPAGAAVTRLIPHGRNVFAALADGCVQGFDAQRGEMFYQAMQGAVVRHIGHVNERTIVTADDAGIVKWYESPRVVQAAVRHGAPIVSFEIDGDRVTTASEDGRIRWWDARDGRALGSHQGVFGLRGAKWIPSPHDALVMWGRDGTVSVLQRDKETVVAMHRGEVSDVAIAAPRDARTRRVRRGKPLLVSCATDGSVEVRQFDSIAAFDTLDASDEPVLGCTIAPSNGEIVSWDQNGRVAGWLPGDKPVVRLFGEPVDRPDVRVHRSVSGRSVVVSADRDLLCYEAGRKGGNDGEKLAQVRKRWPRTVVLDEHFGLVDVRPVEMKMRDRVARQLLPWKVFSPQNVRAFRKFAAALKLTNVDGVALSLSNKQWVAVTWTRGGELYVEAERDRRVTFLGGHRSSIVAARWVDSSRLATASADGTLRVLDVERRRTEREMVGHTGRVLGCEALYSPDEDRLLSWGDDCTLRWWPNEASDSREAPGATRSIATLLLPDRPSAVALLRDDRIVVGTRSGQLMVVDRVLTTYSAPLQAHHGRITGLVPCVIHADRVGVVTCGDDGRVRVWSIGSDHRPQLEDVAVGDAPFTQIVPLGERATAVALVDEPGAIWVFDAGPPPWIKNPREEALKRKRL